MGGLERAGLPDQDVGAVVDADQLGAVAAELELDGRSPGSRAVSSARGRSVSQTLTVPSRLEVTIRAPSGLNAAARIDPVWPRSRASSRPSAGSKTRASTRAVLGIEGDQAAAVAAEGQRRGRAANREAGFARRRVEERQGLTRGIDFVGSRAAPGDGRRD